MLTIAALTALTTILCLTAASITVQENYSIMDKENTAPAMFFGSAVLSVITCVTSVAMYVTS